MIDVAFDFTSELNGYWDGFLDREPLTGMGAVDPDVASPTLKEYHRLLWSKQLPNGEMMELTSRKAPYYLTWKDFCFGSDTIIVGFRYARYAHIISQVNAMQDDYKAFWEDLIRKSYTIGGTIIFPVHAGSMNQRKGMHRRISDRWDLTLECIRLYYEGKESPLYKVILKDKEFYDLFVDFKGYVDFFFLQDAVTEDYSKVIIWDGKGDFTENALPKTLEDYLNFLDKEFDFLAKRNQRIAEYAAEYGLYAYEW